MIFCTIFEAVGSALTGDGNSMTIPNTAKGIDITVIAAAVHRGGHQMPKSRP